MDEKAASGVRAVVIHEGTCVRCSTDCTRRPGEPWYNRYGRDECRAAGDDGTGHDVPAWTVREGQCEPPLPTATVTLFGLDADGRPVIVAGQRVPVGNGVFYEETFAGGETVTRWRVSFSQGQP